MFYFKIKFRVLINLFLVLNRICLISKFDFEKNHKIIIRQILIFGSIESNPKKHQKNIENRLFSSNFFMFYSIRLDRYDTVRVARKVLKFHCI